MIKIKNVNGIDIKTDFNKNDKLVTISYVVNVGSYNEDETNLGISHLVEHLLFRGTINKTSEEINQYIEKLGGYINAFTSYEQTVFYCTVSSQYWKEALNFLNDLIFFNTIPEETFDLEKNIVMNELRMYGDDPTNVCQENLYKLIFNNAINRQLVGGTVDTVKNITREQVIEYINDNYINNNIEIVICGNIEDSEENLYDFIESIVPEIENKEIKKDNFDFDIKKIEVENYKDNIYQSILCWAFIGPEKGHKDYIPFLLVINALGGNASSVLYNEVREKKGLVYTISMWAENFNDYTLGMGYTSLQKEHIDKVKNIIDDRIKNVKINQEVLNTNINYLVGQALMSFEKTSGRNEYLRDNKDSYDEYIEKIKSVTLRDIERVIRKYFKNNIYYSSLISK